MSSRQKLFTRDFPSVSHSRQNFAPTPLAEMAAVGIAECAREAFSASLMHATAEETHRQLNELSVLYHQQRNGSLHATPRALQEVLAMADYLGVPCDGDLGNAALWIADAALCPQLPIGWEEHFAPDGAPYYYHGTLGGACVWEHPQLALLRGVAQAIR